MKERITLPLVCCLLALTGLMAGCTVQNIPAPSKSSALESQTTLSEREPAEKKQLPESPGETLPAEKPLQDGTTTAIENAPAEKKELAPQQSYDFSQPVPESEPVDNSYFEDAAFIGDSRTDGFLIYSGIGCGENLTSNGLSIFKLAEKKAITIDGTQYTLLEALKLKQYGKVYLSLGVNELGYHNDQGFYDSYCQAIDMIRESQPNAVIYIQGLIPLNEDVIAETGGSSYLKNDHLLVYNDLMKKAAEEKQVAFLDLNPAFVGEDGQLPREASKDGIHLRKAYCEQWLEYLKTHTVSYETLYPEGNT